MFLGRALRRPLTPCQEIRPAHELPGPLQLQHVLALRVRAAAGRRHRHRLLRLERRVQEADAERAAGRAESGEFDQHDQPVRQHVVLRVSGYHF